MSAANRFISLVDDDPDDSDVASTPSLGRAAAKPIDAASADSEGTEFLSVEDEGYDNLYFQQGSDQLPREQWKITTKGCAFVKNWSSSSMHIKTLKPRSGWTTPNRCGDGQM